MAYTRRMLTVVKVIELLETKYSIHDAESSAVAKAEEKRAGEQDAA